ncbi:MAG: hypothetical protein K2X66_13350 [Cyanobacteria bacterium]|nr:hypothetical protein [Cyanobacteriota bacterium]
MTLYFSNPDTSSMSRNKPFLQSTPINPKSVSPRNTQPLSFGNTSPVPKTELIQQINQLLNGKNISGFRVSWESIPVKLPISAPERQGPDFPNIPPFNPSENFEGLVIRAMNTTVAKQIEQALLQTPRTQNLTLMPPNDGGKQAIASLNQYFFQRGIEAIIRYQEIPSSEASSGASSENGPPPRSILWVTDALRRRPSSSSVGFNSSNIPNQNIVDALQVLPNVEESPPLFGSGQFPTFFYQDQEIQVQSYEWGKIPYGEYDFQGNPLILQVENE